MNSSRIQRLSLNSTRVVNGILPKLNVVQLSHEEEIGRIKRFLKFVGPLPHDENDCWRWKGGCTSRGYGAIHWNRQQYLAHRFAYELFVGAIADDLFVCHSCDNPRCVSPHHLWLGTHADNMADMVLKNRAREFACDLHDSITPDVRFSFRTSRHT